MTTRPASNASLPCQIYEGRKSDTLDFSVEKDEDTTLWVLGLRTLVHDLGGVDPTFDALEFGRFLWERTLMGAREVAPPETVLTTLRDELRLKQPEVAEDEMIASAAALRALFGPI